MVQHNMQNTCAQKQMGSQLTLLHDIKPNKQPIGGDAQLATLWKKKQRELQQQHQLYQPLKIMLNTDWVFLVCDKSSSVLCAIYAVLTSL